MQCLSDSLPRITEYFLRVYTSLFRTYSLLLFITSGLWASSATALNEERLWLPRQYQSLFFSLRDAAVVAENTEKCTDVLRGTLDLDISKPDKPIFRILCRAETGKTYNLMVDGVSQKPILTAVMDRKPLTEEELNEKAQAEKQQAILSGWYECEKTLAEKVKLMPNIRWASVYPPTPREYSEHLIEFILDFDTEDMFSQPLHYRFTCTYFRPELDEKGKFVRQKPLDFSIKKRDSEQLEK